jgi:predicted nucleic acid-binding protein
MVQRLDSVPAGSDVLIDANIFVYGLTAQSGQCKALLERCSREEVTGTTIFEVVHEATHQFMLAEATAKAGQRRNAKYLSQHPNEVQGLTQYWANTLRLLSLNILFLPMEEPIITRAQSERVSAGLLTTDSVIVAAMREYGLTRIATNDRQFGSVPGISVYAPTDIVI